MSIRVHELLTNRMADLDPNDSHRKDPHSQMSLKMLRILLTYVEAACEAQDLPSETVYKILDYVTVAALPSPSYHMLIDSYNNLLVAHEKLMEHLPPVRIYGDVK